MEVDLLGFVEQCRDLAKQAIGKHVGDPASGGIARWSMSFCTDCGLIVADEWVDLSPTLHDLGLVGDADQSIETVDPLRADKGLHTKIRRNTDGHGNSLSNEQWEKVQRLRK